MRLGHRNKELRYARAKIREEDRIRGVTPVTPGRNTLIVLLNSNVIASRIDYFVSRKL